jgi:hypothetical protein
MKMKETIFEVRGIEDESERERKRERESLNDVNIFLKTVISLLTRTSNFIFSIISTIVFA